MAAAVVSFELSELESAAELVHRVVPPTPQYAWPKLRRRIGCTVWVKHENHTPTGAFKVRGGIVYLDRLTRTQSKVAGLISATRGNHGQSISFAAARAGIPVTIYVPRGNSPDQNSAMETFGANDVEVGKDCRGAARFVEVSEDEIAEAMRIYFDDTHQIAEGAGAAPLAALLQERQRLSDRNAGVILSGGNIERACCRY